MTDKTKADAFAKAKTDTVAMTDDDDATLAILFVGHARLDTNQKTKAKTVHIWPTRTKADDGTTTYDDTMSLDGGETWTADELKMTKDDAVRFLAAIGGEEAFDVWTTTAKRRTLRGEATYLKMAAAPVPAATLTNVPVTKDAKDAAIAKAKAAREAKAS